MDSARHIQTVTGPVSAGEVGCTLIREVGRPAAPTAGSTSTTSGARVAGEPLARVN